MGLSDEAQAVPLATAVLDGIRAIEALTVPTLALIQGQCYAGALELCLACDLIWAAEGSQIGQIETIAGGIPFAGGTQRLASRIGAARAAEMVFTAAILPPETLASWGVINRVTPADVLAEEGRAFARTLSNGPTCAYATVKRLLHAWRSGGVAAADGVNLAEGPGINGQPGSAERHQKSAGRRAGPRHVRRPLTPPAGGPDASQASTVDRRHLGRIRRRLRRRPGARQQRAIPALPRPRHTITNRGGS